MPLVREGHIFRRHTGVANGHTASCLRIGGNAPDDIEGNESTTDEKKKVYAPKGR